MKCELVKLYELSGNKASIYSVFINDKNKTLLDIFVEENKILHKSETKDIYIRLRIIGMKSGVKEHYIKPNEGRPGDGVCALYDEPDKKLRLYCISYGSILLIVGSGGVKPKDMKTFQEVEKLKIENYLLRKLSEEITIKIKNKSIEFINDGMDLKGDLKFDL